MPAGNKHDNCINKTLWFMYFLFLYLCQKKVSILKNALLKNKTANKIPLTKYTMLVAKAQRLEKKRK